MPGRWWDSSLALNAKTTYRYGFNGPETDAEIAGRPHAHFSTMFRQYDPRVARWWSNDPITHSWESPYAAMAGNPILLGDPLGLEGGEGFSVNSSIIAIPPEDEKGRHAVVVKVSVCLTNSGRRDAQRRFFPQWEHQRLTGQRTCSCLR